MHHEYDPTKHWIGVDLDGTLAMNVGWAGVAHVGLPIWIMVCRIKDWIKEGKTVKIFTARVALPEYIEEKGEEAIRDFLFSCGLPKDLEITNVKDIYMLELWDDRAVQVQKNTGQPVLVDNRGMRLDRIIVDLNIAAMGYDHSDWKKLAVATRDLAKLMRESL